MRQIWALAIGAAVAMAGLGGCFSSRAPLIGAAESVAILGPGGPGRRVAFAEFGAGLRAEAIIVAWEGSAYAITDSRGRREKLLYRFAPLAEGWHIAQRMDHAVTDYGLARFDEGTLWLYAPQCMSLGDSARAALGVRLGTDGGCQVSTLDQLKAALSAAARTRPNPIGYFEPLRPVDARARP